MFVFLKYFIFGDSESVRRGRRKGKDERRIRGQKQGRSKGYRERDRRKGRNVSAGTASSDESSSSSSSSSDEGCSRSDKQEQSSSIAAAANAAASVLRSNRPLSASTLLDKTYYHTRHDLHNSAVETDHRTEYAEQHQKHHNQQGRRKHYQYHDKHNKNHTHHDPESLDWFNVLVAQAIAQLRADAFSNNVLLVRSLTEALNGNAKSDWMDEIRVTEISLGEEFPIFKNCRIVSGRPAGSERYGDGDFGYEETLGGEGEGEEGLRKQRRIKRKKAKKVLQAHMDVELRDAITLGLETKLVLNYPRPLAAMLPVGLVVEVVRFEGTVSNISSIHLYTWVIANDCYSCQSHSTLHHRTIPLLLRIPFLELISQLPLQIKNLLSTAVTTTNTRPTHITIGIPPPLPQPLNDQRHTRPRFQPCHLHPST